ncbi:MAG: T9SS type A sorting domain-containing protein, partial [Bacteroidia bacterium]|nr:T9SS type A sorting domain-containing protein [Bacteroidia bacterium]
LDSTFKVYPNPTNNTFSVNKAVSNVALYNFTGKLVKEFKGSFNLGEQFNISELANSMYIVEFTNQQGLKQTTKLIKL